LQNIRGGQQIFASSLKAKQKSYEEEALSLSIPIMPVRTHNYERNKNTSHLKTKKISHFLLGKSVP
jgi:hypothetical protein